MDIECLRTNAKPHRMHPNHWESLRFWCTYDSDCLRAIASSPGTQAHACEKGWSVSRSRSPACAVHVFIRIVHRFHSQAYVFGRKRTKSNGLLPIFQSWNFVPLRTKKAYGLPRSLTRYFDFSSHLIAFNRFYTIFENWWSNESDSWRIIANFHFCASVNPP